MVILDWQNSLDANKSGFFLFVFVLPINNHSDGQGFIHHFVMMIHQPAQGRIFLLSRIKSG